MTSRIHITFLFIRWRFVLRFWTATANCHLRLIDGPDYYPRWRMAWDHWFCQSHAYWNTKEIAYYNTFYSISARRRGLNLLRCYDDFYQPLPKEKEKPMCLVQSSSQAMAQPKKSQHLR